MNGQRVGVCRYLPSFLFRLLPARQRTVGSSRERGGRGSESQPAARAGSQRPSFPSSREFERQGQRGAKGERNGGGGGSKMTWDRVSRSRERTGRVFFFFALLRIPLYISPTLHPPSNPPLVTHEEARARPCLFGTRIFFRVRTPLDPRRRTPVSFSLLFSFSPPPQACLQRLCDPVPHLSLLVSAIVSAWHGSLWSVECISPSGF